MKIRPSALAFASSFLSVALVGCNPPIDEKKGDTGAPTATTTKPADSIPVVTPAPAETKPGDMAPAPTTTPAPTPAVEAPKVDDKPADATPTPKDEAKKDQAPKAA